MEKAIDPKFQKKMRATKIAMILCMVLIICSIGIAIYLMSAVDYSCMPDEYKIDMGSDLFCMFLSLLLLYSCYQEDRTDRNNRSLMRLIMVIAIALFVNFMEGFSEGRTNYEWMTKTLVTMEYLCDDLIVVLFWNYIYGYLPHKKRDDILNIIVLAIMSISIGITLLNYFLEFYFYLDPNGALVERQIVAISDIPGMMVYVISMLFICMSSCTKQEKLVLLSFEVFPIAGTLIISIVPSLSVLYPAYLLSVILIYIDVYQERKKKIAEQNNLLTKQSMALMISQIQPHFLYNTLTTISNLCVKDPEQAEETTVMFSRYLRGNLDSLRRTEPVPFPMELDHIRIYVELEQRRFEDRLNVTYDIQDTAFVVPSLGLQPIVENSIKHGICKKMDPGHLLIATKKTKAGHVVIIEDDGVGFDPAAPIQEDGRSHVGLSNVKSRLERMCGAKMEVTSSPGRGCRTVITFPDK